MAGAAEIVETLRALLSGDNDRRTKAEKAFSDAKSQQPGATVGALFLVLSDTSLEEGVREQGVVLLRQCLSKVRDASSTWSQLGQATHEEVKAKLLQLFVAEPSDKVRRKVADAVQNLGHGLIDIDDSDRPTNIQEWPELMPSIMRVVVDSSKTDGMRVDALWTVQELLGSCWQMMLANVSNTQQVLKACLDAPSVSVKAAAAELLCRLVDFVADRKERSAFQPLIPDLCAALQMAAQQESNKGVNSLLQAMQGEGESLTEDNEGAPNVADFFKDAAMEMVMPCLVPIGKAHKEEDTQRLALEVMVSLVEGKPKAYAKLPGFLPAFVEVCVTFLTRLDEDMAEWCAEEDEDADDEENFNHAKQSIDRVCRVLASSGLFPVAMEALKPAIASLFQSADWRFSTGGLALLSQIAEYVDEEDAVLQMLVAIKAQLRAQCPRVRHAAWAAVAQLSQDHAEAVTSDSQATPMLQEFLAGLDDPVQRVSMACMEAFCFYGSDVERELVEPVVQPMMEKLGAKLQGGVLTVQKKAITCIAVLAGQMEDGFAAYYAPLMPVLTTLVQGLVHKNEERELLGKTFECISLLAAAVGPEGFKSDAQAIMEAMMKATQVPNLPANDPVREYMLFAAQRICSTMKEGFLPFVPFILPGVLAKLALAPKEFNKDMAEKLDDNDEVNLSFARENGKIKVMIMSTSEMEDLENAVGCVHTFVEELGKAYAPFVAQTAQALLLVFDFGMDEEIREVAFDTWGLLCQSAREGGQAGVVTELVHEFLKRVIPKFEEEPVAPEQGVPETAGDEALKTAADGVTACLKKAGPGVLSAQQLSHICQVAFKVLYRSLRERGVQEASQRAKEDDEDGNEQTRDIGSKLRISCCEMVGALASQHPAEFHAQCLAPCMQLVQQFIPSAVRWEDRRLALFVVCDLLEYLRAELVPQWPHFMQQILEDITHQSPALRQPACYAVFLAAREAAFSQFAQAAAERLSQLSVSTRGAAKKKSERAAQACADNALSALAQILKGHKEPLGAAASQLWSVWLECLPCQLDQEEGVRNHSLLLELAQAENPDIVGAGGANMPKVLSILVDVYKTEMAGEEASKGIGKFVRALGQGPLEQIASQFKDKQRKKLLRIHREAEA